jgi:hypothetical protein
MKGTDMDAHLTLIKLQLFPISTIPPPGKYYTYRINDYGEIDIRSNCVYEYEETDGKKYNRWDTFPKDPETGLTEIKPEYWSYIPKIPKEPLRGKLSFILFDCEFEY